MAESTITFPEDEEFVFMVRTGEAQPGEFFAAMMSAVADSRYKRGMGFLVDARDVDFSKQDRSHLTEFKDDWAAFENFTGETKVAVINSPEQELKIIDSASSIIGFKKIERRSFFDMDDAKAWLTCSETNTAA